MVNIPVSLATGFIGSHPTDLLLADGHAFAGIDDFQTRRGKNLAATISRPGR